nr:hypothetical protein [Tanacetum cinerariifolium]
MNGWLEEDDDVNENVNNEDIEDEDVEVELDDDAELIFPYEVQGDQTPPPRDESSDSEPPRDESSDSVSSNSKLEDEEANIAPEATVGTVTQRPLLFVTFQGNRRFYMEMVRKGTVPKPSSEDESTKRLRKKSKKPSSDGTEGPFEPRGPPSDSQTDGAKAGDAGIGGAKTGGAGTGGAETGGAGTGGAEAGGAEAGGARPAVPEIT